MLVCHIQWMSTANSRPLARDGKRELIRIAKQIPSMIAHDEYLIIRRPTGRALVVRPFPVYFLSL